MSEALDDNAEFRPMYATLFWGGRHRGQCVQITLVDRDDAALTIDDRIGRVAYASVPVAEFRAWLREVSDNLDRLTTDHPADAGGR